MDLYFDMKLVQSQKVLLTPQLKQAFDILRMNSQELFEYVEEQLEENPALEILESVNSDGYYNCAYKDDSIGWGDSNINTDTLRKPGEDENEEEYNMSTGSADEKLSLKEHLLFQLHTSDLSENQMCIGEYLIDNIDENGYLIIGLTEVAEFFNVTASKVKKVLEYLQTFDPPGICARSLKECLLIQLNQLSINDKEDAQKLVENHLDDLAGEKLDFVAKNMGLPLHRVEEVFRVLKTLEPKPGREYYNNTGVKYIIPDIIIRNSNGRFETVVNEDAVPLLNINEYYRKILSADVGNEVKRFIVHRIDNAAWLLKCIEERKNMLKKAAECIVAYQLLFFEKGKQFLSPISKKTISDEIGVHESVIEEILSGKYIQCAWGVFEMKDFIS
ncbi:MAG: RNA polymerase factor sigma-54 [Clostridia bacterium]|nr:RNA polymerase factor sigma-54 [Clostridia bacterium]